MDSILARSATMSWSLSVKASGLISTWMSISSRAPSLETWIMYWSPTSGICISVYSIWDGNTLIPRTMSMSSDLPEILAILGEVLPQGQSPSITMVRSLIL